MSNIDDLLLGGGAAGKGMKFDQPGKSYGGTVVSVEVRPYTDLKTGKPEFWDDDPNQPKQQLAIGIQTDERNPEIQDDDGVRYDYVKMWGKQKAALRVAAQAAGGSPAVGDFYSVKFVGEEPSKTRGFNPTKLYEYTIRKANPADAALGVAAPQAQAQAPAQSFPQTAPAQPYEAPVAPAAQAAPVGLGATVPAPGQLTAQQEEQAKTLISKALTDEQIASILGTPAEAVATIRQSLQFQQAALAGAGY